jgi:signal peptidase I
MIRPRGLSMMPIIKPGQYVLLEPIGDKDLEVGEVVLVKVKASVYLHKVTALDGDRVQIGNNRGHINGWTVKDKVYGRVSSVST